MKAAASRAAAARALPREVRVIAGVWKRSKLPVADRPGLRPTPARVRETLFDWLGVTLTGWRAVDAFAGSGALGFEAASRGAAEVVLVERDAALVASLAATKARLGADVVRVERGDALQWLGRAPEAAFDLVFLDPPFGAGLGAPALAAASRVVAADGFVYVEAPTPIDATIAGGDDWVVHRASRAGAVHFGLLRKSRPSRDGRGYTAREFGGRADRASLDDAGGPGSGRGDLP